MLFTSDSCALWRFSNRTRIDGLCKKILQIGRNTYTKEDLWNFQSILVPRLIPGGKEKDKARQAVFFFVKLMFFFFGDDSEEDESYDDFTVPQKASYVTKLKYYQNAVYWVRWSKAQDQGLEFWQTKSFAIMTHASILGGCIGRVTPQNGERVDFERLEFPRPVP